MKEEKVFQLDGTEAKMWWATYHKLIPTKSHETSAHMADQAIQAYRSRMESPVEPEEPTGYVIAKEEDPGWLLSGQIYIQQSTATDVARKVGQNSGHRCYVCRLVRVS